jgi:glyoxylase-like metal-dependent hydrolase (beta-lactamase superfamily II)
MGRILDFDLSLLTARRNMGIRLDVPCLAWLILGGTRPVLVDTGPPDQDFCARHHRPVEQNPGEKLPALLGALGVDPASIETVVLTHLHWDHCFNAGCLPNARFFVQQAELRYAVAPLPVDRQAYEALTPGLVPPWMAYYDRIAVVCGDIELLPGIRLLHTPGHTPGSQSVAVETIRGPWLIAGDTVPVYANWRTGGEKIPSGLAQDLRVYYDTLNKLKKFGDNILPGHDAAVLEHTVYPVLRSKGKRRRRQIRRSVSPPASGL